MIRGMKTQTTMAQIASRFSENGIYLKKTKDYQMTKRIYRKSHLYKISGN